MSALAMILTAAMAVPGDGPKKVSGEMVQQRLDLSGEWRSYFKGVLDLSKGEINLERLSIIDEGAGRLRLKLRSVDNIGFYTCYGIYEQNGDRLKICFAFDGKSRPTRFHHGGGQYLYDLRRVTSSK